MRSTPSPTLRELLPSSGRRLTGADLMARFGISSRTLYNWIRDSDVGLPAAIVVKGKNYWPEDAIERWEASRMSAPIAEVA